MTYYEEIVLPTFTSEDLTGDVTVSLKSLQGNGKTTQISV